MNTFAIDDGLVRLAMSRVPWPPLVRQAVHENPQALAIMRRLRPGYDNRGSRKARQRIWEQHLREFAAGTYIPKLSPSYLQDRLAWNRMKRRMNGQ